MSKSRWVELDSKRIRISDIRIIKSIEDFDDWQRESSDGRAGLMNSIIVLANTQPSHKTLLTVDEIRAMGVPMIASWHTIFIPAENVTAINAVTAFERAAWPRKSGLGEPIPFSRIVTAHGIFNSVRKPAELKKDLAASLAEFIASPAALKGPSQG